MNNLISGKLNFEGKKYNNNTHFSMPKINYNRKKRRRISYQGIINQQEPAKNILPVLPFSVGANY